MEDLETVAPAFVEMAHSIVWCTAATVDTAGRPRTRVLHPIWEWDGTELVGWIATSPTSLKAKHLARLPRMSCTYWATNHDTCTADCDTSWHDEARERLWQLYTEAPAPLGYDPRMIPGWESPSSPGFGALRLRPTRLSLMPGSLLMQGTGRAMAWQAS
ncbi:MAG TPA: pyridoxamine 5'-phosphate oxidase family protein [Acidimicrobiales bacterium]